jgi:hypothetical protein
MMEEWSHAAQNILAHFHAICKGQYALLQDWNDKQVQLDAEVDDQAAIFLQNLRGLVHARGKPS